MTRILVTGANGHLGTNIVRSLLHRGYEVVAFVRHKADLRGLAGLDVTYRYGDIMEYASLAAACEGCDAAIHTATAYNIWAKRVDELVQPALVGSHNMLQAAKEQGLRRLVYTSSIAAVGYAYNPDHPRNESEWNEDARNPYFQAKVQSERETLRLATELGVPTIRLCPSPAVGPYDYRLTPSSRRILELINSGMIYDGGYSLADIRDVAAVHAAAVEQGEPGRRYVYGGANLHQRELGAIVAQQTGIKPWRLPLGKRPVMFLGRLQELASKVTGKAPSFDAGIIYDTMHRYGYLDSSLAIDAFGVVPRPAEKTVRDCIRWLLHLGVVKRSIPPHLLAALAPDSDWLATAVSPQQPPA